MPYAFNPFTGKLDYYEASTGTPGPQGAAGSNGMPGRDGEDGSDGFPGIQGIAGTNGTNGTNGLDGLTIRGQDGEDGDTGYILLQPTGGSTLIPATTVVSETSASQSPAVGTSLNYAREDHTHGTPAAGAGSNWGTVKNSTGVGEIATIAIGFQFICFGIFSNRGDVINRGDFAVF